MISSRRRRWATGVVITLGATAVSSLALVLGPVGASPSGYTTKTVAGEDRLYQIDAGTGASTLVAATGLSPSTVLAFAPDGTLYGVNRSNHNLYTIDPATAVPTLVGPLGITTGGGTLTVAGDGQLWFVKGNPSDLYRVDRTTGTATLVGAINQGAVTGLAGTCDGRLFGFSIVGDNPVSYNLVQVDPTTGSGTVIGSTGLPANSQAWLAFDTAETLWGNVFVSAEWDKIYTFSTSTGTATWVADTGSNQNTLALPHTCASAQPASQVVTGPNFTG